MWACAHGGWGWAEASQEHALGGGVQWVQEDLLVSGLLKLSCSLPALCWHQAVSPTQELVVPTALEGPQSFLFLRDGSRWKDQEG